MNNESVKPYVLSQDINYLLSSWAKKTKLAIPAIGQYQGEITRKLQDIFPKVDVISEPELQNSARRTLEFCKENKLACLSLDRAYMPAVDSQNLTFYIDSSRQVDNLLNSKGLGTRSSQNSELQKQFYDISNIIGDTEVVIFDDVAFGGDTVLQLAELAKNAGIKIARLDFGIATSEALEKIGIAGYKSKSYRTYSDLIDEVCERDYFIGSPLSGRTLQTTEGTKGIPYLEPFGKPDEWGSIPKNESRLFSYFCLTVAREFWSESQQMNKNQIIVNQLDKPPIIFELQKPIVNEISRSIDSLGIELPESI